MHFDSSIYSLVLTELASRISSDQIIIEELLRGSKNKISSRKINSLVSRNRYNILILSELIFIGRHIPDTGLKNTSLLDCVQKASAIFNNQIVDIENSREKPLIDVIGDKYVLIAVLKILLSLLILEDNSLKKMRISFRRRGDFVTIKVIGGVHNSPNLFYKDLENLINSILKNYSASARFTVQSKLRIAFIRLYLSNQISLGYNR